MTNLVEMTADSLDAEPPERLVNENGETLDTKHAGKVFKVPDTGDVPYGFGGTLGREIGRIEFIEYEFTAKPVREPELDAVFLELVDGRQITLEVRHLEEGDHWDQLAFIALREEGQEFEQAVLTLHSDLVDWNKARDKENEWITSGEFVTLYNVSELHDLLSEVEGEVVSNLEPEFIRRVYQFVEAAANGAQEGVMHSVSWAKATVVRPPRDVGESFTVKVHDTCGHDAYELGEQRVNWYEVYRDADLPTDE